jgi:hypothetical protein
LETTSIRLRTVAPSIQERTGRSSGDEDVLAQAAQQEAEASFREVELPLRAETLEHVDRRDARFDVGDEQ